ncbi:MAG: metallophosphoesterase family protein [bacterium]|nr:metallophosphoesterase family protein [bacterium]
MRTLIIADIHANFDALSVLPEADAILCAGDLVTFGVEPNECVEWLMTRPSACIRGEEDDAVANGVPHLLPEHLVEAGTESREWTRRVLKPGLLAWLSTLPPELEIEVEGRRIALVHAYPGDYNRYLMPTEDELHRITRAFPRADVIVTAHTHRQGVWRYGGKVIVNPGSVGQNAKQGVAAYALLEGGRITFGAAPYGIGAVVRKLRWSSLRAGAREACVREIVHGSDRPKNRLPWPKPSTLA